MRDQIEKYLGTVAQSTAKAIAERIGMDRHDVALELNRMLGDGIIEREKRSGGGNEYTYGLSRGETISAAIRKEAAAIMQTAAAPRNTAAPVVAEATPEPSDERRGALEHLHERMAELFEVLGLPQTIDAAIAAAREMKQASVQIANDRDHLAQENQRLNARLAEQDTERDVLLAANSKLRENNAALERRIDELTIVDAEFRPSTVYVTVGRDAKPKRHSSLDRAQRRAAALIRSDRESEVLVCEPIGRMVRGSEWRKR